MAQNVGGGRHHGYETIFQKLYSESERNFFKNANIFWCEKFGWEKPLPSKFLFTWPKTWMGKTTTIQVFDHMTKNLDSSRISIPLFLLVWFWILVRNDICRSVYYSLAMSTCILHTRSINNSIIIIMCLPPASFFFCLFSCNMDGFNLEIGTSMLLLQKLWSAPPFSKNEQMASQSRGNKKWAQFSECMWWGEELACLLRLRFYRLGISEYLLFA